MAPADLTAPNTRLLHAGRQLAPWKVFGLAFAAVWGLTLLAALLGALPQLIKPQLQLHPHSTPSAPAAITTWMHNIRVAGWPLLAVALRLHRRRWRRRLGDIAIAASLAANTIAVGAAIAAGHEQILPYLPHLPFEWAAMALSATGWLLATRWSITRRELARLAVVFALVLAGAAVLETYAVPHL